MMETCRGAYGSPPYRVEGGAVICGRDLLLSFTGGTHAHIGGVSLAVYEPSRDPATVSTISVYMHRDDQLAMKAAKRAAVRSRCTVTVTVGIHMDDAKETDIRYLSENFWKCYEQIEEEIGAEIGEEP